ncbi:hypothetical protein LTR53_017078 [Teratosphaeriaceae sp. CCFEE 6253]|nr:hypothetical protein LTR53_017078 [Teratosphaeriaceae sp. CCFEE 6253]
MGQCWKIVNIDARQELENQCGFKFREFLRNGIPAQLVGLLEVPRLRVHESRDAAVGVCSALIRLPQEIIDNIVEHIIAGPDLICLALTCSYYLRLQAQRVSPAIVADEAPWAGKRLVAVGDSAEFVPSSVSDEEARTIFAGYVATHSDPDEIHEYSDDEDDDNASLTATRNNLLYHMNTCKGSDRLCSHPEALEATSGFPRELVEAQWNISWRNSIKRQRQHRLTADEMALPDRMFLHPGPDGAGPLVARCLDLKEYLSQSGGAWSVKNCECDDFDEECQCGYVAHLYGLGELIFCMIAWSEEGPSGR